MTAPWLSDRERTIAIDRLKDNKTGVKNARHKKDQIFEALLDIKVWLLVGGVFFYNLTISLQSTFSGIMLIGYGFTANTAVLVGVPSGLILSVGSFVLTYYLSKPWGRGKRIWSIVACFIPGLIATVMLFKLPRGTTTKGAHLAAILILGLVTISQGIVFSLISSNIAGYTKKVVTGSLVFTAWAVSNILSPQVRLNLNHLCDGTNFKTGFPRIRSSTLPDRRRRIFHGFRRVYRSLHRTLLSLLVRE